VNAEDLKILSELCTETGDVIERLRALAQTASKGDATDVHQAVKLLKHNLGVLTEEIADREAKSWGNLSHHNARNAPNQWIRTRPADAPTGAGSGIRVKVYDGAGTFAGWKDA
jgi:hypothetical protein